MHSCGECNVERFRLSLSLCGLEPKWLIQGTKKATSGYNASLWEVMIAAILKETMLHHLLRGPSWIHLYLATITFPRLVLDKYCFIFDLPFWEYDYKTTAVYSIYSRLFKAYFYLFTHSTVLYLFLISSSVNFKDPQAVRALTCTLLKEDFGLQIDIPLERLIPTVPLRLNYIHWVEDLIAQQDTGTKGSVTWGIDIGML